MNHHPKKWKSVSIKKIKSNPAINLPQSTLSIKLVDMPSIKPAMRLENIKKCTLKLRKSSHPKYHSYQILYTVLQIKCTKIIVIKKEKKIKKIHRGSE